VGKRRRNHHSPEQRQDPVVSTIVCPSGKIVFRTKKAARERGRQHPAKLDWYRCRQCPGYHMTSMQKHGWPSSNDPLPEPIPSSAHNTDSN